MREERRGDEREKIINKVKVMKEKKDKIKELFLNHTTVTWQGVLKT